MRLRSSRSSTMRREALRFLDDPFGQRARHRRDRPPRPASRPAPRARRSASSARGSRWRRSRGARSRCGAPPRRRRRARPLRAVARRRRWAAAERCTHRPRRAEELQLALAGAHRGSAREISESSAPATTASECRAVAVALGGGVAEHLDAVGIEHKTACAQLVERGPEAVVLHGGGLGLPEGLGQRLFQRGVRGVAPLRAHGAQPNRPVM